MLTDVKFKGLYKGRLSYVEYPEIVGFQILGVVFFKFNQELNAAFRSQILSLLQKTKKDGVVISFVLIFPDLVAFSGVDMNLFREIQMLLSGAGSQFTIVCGNEEMQKLNSYSKTRTISIFTSLTEALVNTKSQYLMTFGSTLTRNIMVYDSDPELRNAIVDHLKVDRFSAIGVPTIKEAKEFLNKFGPFLDGAIFEVTNPDLKEFKLVEQFRALKPDAKILIHSEIYDSKFLETCKKNKITCVIKSPFKPIALIRKFKLEFPERHSNYLGFSE